MCVLSIKVPIRKKKSGNLSYAPRIYFIWLLSTPLLFDLFILSKNLKLFSFKNAFNFIIVSFALIERICFYLRSFINTTTTAFAYWWKKISSSCIYFLYNNISSLSHTGRLTHRTFTHTEYIPLIKLTKTAIFHAIIFTSNFKEISTLWPKLSLHTRKDFTTSVFKQTFHSI